METGFVQYVKRAFFFHWNLLALGAAASFGIISGYPDVVLPIAAAVELLYLAKLSTNEKFQAAIDAETHKKLSAKKNQDAEIKTKLLLDSLSPKDKRTFNQLKSQIANLSKIAESFGPSSAVSRTSGMNRLLWIYLKLLYSKNAVEKFFMTTDLSAIDQDFSQAKSRLATLGPVENDSPTDSKRRASLEDRLKTCELRLENYQRAKDNYEFIQDELARLSAKIAALAEMAVARQDPNFISEEVDIVSKSVEAGEKAMSEIDFLTGWSCTDENTPDLISEAELNVGEER